MKQKDIIIIFCNYSINESFYQIWPWEHAQYVMVLALNQGKNNRSNDMATLNNWNWFFLAGLLKKQSFKKDFFLMVTKNT